MGAELVHVLPWRPRAQLNSGTQRFFFEVRDAAAAVTHAEIEFPIIPLAANSASWTAIKDLFGE